MGGAQALREYEPWSSFESYVAPLRWVMADCHRAPGRAIPQAWVTSRQSEALSAEWEATGGGGVFHRRRQFPPSRSVGVYSDGSTPCSGGGELVAPSRSATQVRVVERRSGDRYKPSALRAYRLAIEGKLVPALGGLRLSALTRPVVQDFVDGLVGQGRSPSTVRNTVLPLRAIFRRAVARMEVAENPTKGLTLPAVRGRRDRIARPQEAAELIETLELADRVSPPPEATPPRCRSRRLGRR